MARVLVTGGAGFIGSFIVDELLKKKHSVRIFDSLAPQVHLGKMPDYLNKDAEFIKGDVTDYNNLKEALKDIDIVFHKAAVVGVGQSMYKIAHYVKDNTYGTAVLLDILANEYHNVKKLIVASSMSTYGEGAYKCEKCGIISPQLREETQMQKHQWELLCPQCKSHLKPIPTPESKSQDSNSIYALTKKEQEHMCLMVGKSYGIPTVALRYFNVYGPRQSLNNPYTGVAAIFISRIKNDHQPVIYEDGMQTRDFVSVHDVVQANMLAMENSAADYEVFNVGKGDTITIKEVAKTLARLCGKDINPDISLSFRKGDVRHCTADISKIKSKLGYSPKINFEDGMKELMQWSAKQKSTDKFDIATKELEKHGLA